MHAMADAGGPPLNLCPLCGHPTTSTISASRPSSPPLAATRPTLKRNSPPEAPPAVVRVEIGDEAAALREALARQQAALADLQAELDAERGAAAGAASEAMTMILRLQREKAEAMMEARQFRRYAEEKMSHDAAELAVLEETIAKREASVRGLQSLSRLSVANAASLHSTPRVSSTPRNPSTPSTVGAGGYYPPLRCFSSRFNDHPPTASEADVLDMQTPRDHLARLSNRVQMLEHRAPPTSTTTPIIRVAPGSTFPRNPRPFSDTDSLDFCDGEYFPDDDCGASDRVYTVDAIHGRGVPLVVPEGSICGGTPAGSECCAGGPWGEDEDMRRLSARLQALEADRETMRQAIISMGAEKAQVVLLKEIAQQLCKDAPPPLPAVTVGQHYYKGAAPPAVTVTVPRPQRPMVMHRMVLKSQPARTPFFSTVVKWVTSIVSWRRKSSRIKYPIGQCGNNVGLMLLLDKSSKAAGNGHHKPPKRI
ncbi:myosin-binding protein 7-like [Triticum urartu]|uniref:myosin-binding protein 7-like n=1 Tax=Triticum urartu TaxID=4572 RepID=UPI0020441237|nr:myosin-binding protein 7-like [Triticum urartu]